MKQLEIDCQIHAWFAAYERRIAAERELNSAQCDLDNKTRSVAKRLMPPDAKPGEIYIFPSTSEKAVRCFLKAIVAHGTDGAEHHGSEPRIEPHDFNRK